MHCRRCGDQIKLVQVGVGSAWWSERDGRHIYCATMPGPVVLGHEPSIDWDAELKTLTEEG